MKEPQEQAREGTPAKPHRPSLHDIAAFAGVAASTVSRYLNGQLEVKAETESRILRAIGELGYVRNRRGTQKDAAGTRVIGLVVPQIGSEYFSRIAEHVVSCAGAQGYSVLIGSTQNHSRKQLDYVDLLAGAEVAGLIYAGNYAANRAVSAVIGQGLPVVVIDEALTGAPPVDTVLVDDYAGSYQAVAHLVALGHRRIALLTGPGALRSVQERRRGFRDALRNAGLDPEVQLQLSGPFSEDFGAGTLSRLLSAPEPPTAVFAASDAIALGLMTGARNSGLTIPRDLSVVGFDDSPAAAYVSPRLTTIRSSAPLMADQAVSALMEQIERRPRMPRDFIVPVSFILGGSSAAPASVA